MMAAAFFITCSSDSPDGLLKRSTNAFFSASSFARRRISSEAFSASTSAICSITALALGTSADRLSVSVIASSPTGTLSRLGVVVAVDQLTWRSAECAVHLTARTTPPVRKTKLTTLTCVLAIVRKEAVAVLTARPIMLWFRHLAPQPQLKSQTEFPENLLRYLRDGATSYYLLRAHTAPPQNRDLISPAVLCRCRRNVKVITPLRVTWIFLILLAPNGSHSRLASKTTTGIRTMHDQSQAAPIVYIVDDDLDVREGLQNLFQSVGLRSEVFGSSTALLQSKLADEVSCLVLDVRLPGLSGLDFQAELAREQIRMPIIFITGHGDIPMSVRAMKAGAVEFLTKPIRELDLLDAVRIALDRDRARRDRERTLQALRARYDSLSPREREVMTLVAAGLMNKQAAAEIGISEVTVKVHRHNIMQKLGARSLAELIRTADSLGIPRWKTHRN